MMDMRTSLKAYLLSALLSLTVILVLGALPAGASTLEKEGTIYSGSSEQITVGTWPAPTSLHFTVTSNSNVDVYLLTSDELFNYPSGSFSTVKSYENTVKADFSITSSPTESYILVIDNQDNSHPSDAVPTGDANYKATYPDFMSSPQETVTNIFLFMVIIVVVVVVVVIVIIVVIVYFISRSSKPEQPQPMVMPPPQPQYIPPPAAQPAAPPSPYEPPPPDYPPQQQGPQYQQPPQY